MSIQDEHRAYVLEFSSIIDLEDCVFLFNDYGLFCNEYTWDYLGNRTEIPEVEFNVNMVKVYDTLKELIKIK